MWLHELPNISDHRRQDSLPRPVQLDGDPDMTVDQAKLKHSLLLVARNSRDRAMTFATVSEGRRYPHFCYFYPDFLENRVMNLLDAEAEYKNWFVLPV
jgi:hypothetical protein